MKATICKIGEAEGIVIPKDMLERLDWKVGDVLDLRVDGNMLELRAAGCFDEELTDDFHRQLEHARSAMRKYHVALRTLAKS
ncbi:MULTISPECIES: AbrB/MazE/SpoVT family DNA-binding domain-containing protein [unclassified Rhizobium]|uniref:AbrB/MazE/SpoVT family DNA-binding domain-containing protein n=1 Tax=unclassified Rhizobium TaxID=2613769 RepID=UPI0024798445|nr:MULTISPECIES: AbrB/MazE/SpoVT family DNA-binding domain-containing protein [unclassified Rhizobium]MDH7800456.1 antitoxin component of MazEF toxin-antitoxin module [Rhizobium sp. AN70]